MLLKALARSRKIETIPLCWSKLNKTVSTSCKTVYVAEYVSESRIAP